jgi:NTE family protein
MKKVAVACQGGGMHAAFEVGVLTEILKDVKAGKFELVGLSGTSAGALCALMVWYGLAPKNGGGSAQQAIDSLDDFWNGFVASPGAETVLNFFTYRTFRAEEMEIPGLGINAPLFAGSLNPYGAIYKAVADWLPNFGVRKQYFDLNDALDEACPEFNSIVWPNVKTRLLIGASEVVKGFETVFDSGVHNGLPPANKGMNPGDKTTYWRQRLLLTLQGVVASGTLPAFREAEHIVGDGHYWDGLYSQNPPVREFFSKVPKADRPDELWIVRINPQERKGTPKLNASVLDRENELMGNLSLNKELDFIMTVNAWSKKYGGAFASDHKDVIVRTIKMKRATADRLRYSSKFDRSESFTDQLRQEGHQVARNWLDLWPGVDEYPQDARR